jgi:hypothetical protein
MTKTRDRKLWHNLSFYTHNIKNIEMVSLLELYVNKFVVIVLPTAYPQSVNHRLRFS